jgi:hypothetical protein
MHPTRDNVLFIHGGELFNGDKTYVYGELFK